IVQPGSPEAQGPPHWVDFFSDDQLVLISCAFMFEGQATVLQDLGEPALASEREGFSDLLVDGLDPVAKQVHDAYHAESIATAAADARDYMATGNSGYQSFVVACPRNLTHFQDDREARHELRLP
ncbi:MAG: hypothetical protein AAFX00_10945, partial [Pseudomonadota bacterium]